MPQKEYLAQALVDDNFDFDNATVEEYEAMLRARMTAGREAARAASPQGPETDAYFAFYAEADELLIKFNVLQFDAGKGNSMDERQQAKLLGSTIGAMYGGFLKGCGFLEGLIFQQTFQEGLNATMHGMVPEGTISVEAKNGKGN